MKKNIILLFFCCISYFASSQIYTEIYIRDASNIAQIWLDDLNNKQYNKCWELHSNDAKLANGSIEIWQAFIEDVMGEFGELKSRNVIDQYFLSSIEGREDGFYVFVEYECSYTLTKDHRELVILKQNDKAKWEIDSWEYQFISIEE